MSLQFVCIILRMNRIICQLISNIFDSSYIGSNFPCYMTLFFRSRGNLICHIRHSAPV